MIRPFGITHGNEQIVAGDIAGHGLRASIINWGATLQDLRLEHCQHSLVLGFTNLQHYIAHGQHHGAVAGRVINRIGGARARVNGSDIELDANLDGRHTLHGGTHGFGVQTWQIAEHDTDTMLLTLTDPDGHMGFPGTVRACCRYSILSRDQGPALSIELTATTDAPTLVNLGHHSYFRLDPSGDIRSHLLRIDAENYLPSDEDNLPTGDIASVCGTPFDFRKIRPVDRAYDHNFCLAGDRREVTEVAELVSSLSGISMRVATTEPGLQLYTGHGLEKAGQSLDDTPCGPFAGLCLEPQFWPDAPHNAGFPAIDLMPGDRYHQISEFIFSPE